MPDYFIDSHAHLTSDETTFTNLPSILERAKLANVKKIINICTDLDSLEKGLSLKTEQNLPAIFNTAAITPHDVEKIGEESFSTIAYHAKRGDLVAIGETGLDYYYAHSKKEIQQDFLKRYLKLALETALPVVIHCREAFVDFFKILDKEYLTEKKNKKGVLHCFTGTKEEAEEVLKRGFYLSLSGIVTFKKSLELQEVAHFVPLNQLLIETDTPFLAPQKRRGKPNEPSYLIETAEFIANIKGISLEEVRIATSENCQKLFSL